MNVKKGDVNFRVNHIIVIGKVDIIIDSGIINIDIIVKSSIFSIILTAITIVNIATTIATTTTNTLKVYLTRLAPFRRTPYGAVK